MRIGYSEVSPAWTRPTTSSSDIEFELSASVSGIDEPPPAIYGIQAITISPGHPRTPRRRGSPTKKCKIMGAMNVGSFVRESALFEQPAQPNHLLTSSPRKEESPLARVFRKQLRFDCRVVGVKSGSRVKAPWSKDGQDERLPRHFNDPRFLIELSCVEHGDLARSVHHIAKTAGTSRWPRK